MNIMLQIEYIGTEYSGWQKQNNAKTIQSEIENAILKITGEKVELIASGRTDAGVHALSQVANFHTNSNIPPKQMKYALNSVLNDNIRVIGSCDVNDDFHARFSAKRKTYLYRIQTGDVKRAFEKDRAYYVKGNLDLEQMIIQSKFLIGEHDFSAFKSEGSSAQNFVRTVYDLKLTQRDDIIEIEITGNGFLYNMVRIIAGTLIEIGKGREYLIDEILKSKQRINAGPTAPSMGLFLKNVDYNIDN